MRANTPLGYCTDQAPRVGVSIIAKGSIPTSE